jgi:Luciferase-like monooxygenase
MRVGIGLPNCVQGTPGGLLLEWARRAEEAGFSGLATIDRIAYPSYESPIALAGMAGTTTRIGLMTNVLLGPTRDPILLAKEAASLDQISQGQADAWTRRRLSRGRFRPHSPEFPRARPALGSGIGADPPGLAGRADRRQCASDHALTGARWNHPDHGGWHVATYARAPDAVGRRLDRRRRPAGADRTHDRAGAAGLEGSRQAGRAPDRRPHLLRAGTPSRRGRPRLPQPLLQPPALGTGNVQSIPRSPDAVHERLRQYEEVGVQELFLDPTIAELEQVDRIAEAALR